MSGTRLATGMVTAAGVAWAGAQAQPAPPGVVISAVYPDGYAPGDADEAVQLWNTGIRAVDLAGWSVSDGEGTATFPPGATLAAGRRVWLTQDAAAFARSFGHGPDWVWAGGVPVGATVQRMGSIHGGPALANAGDEVVLRVADGGGTDTVIYGKGATAAAGWHGPSVQPFAPPGVSAAHQVLYRKLESASGRPFVDTDRAVNWASDPADAEHGRRVRFPGWDLEAHVRTETARDAGRVEVAVAPDALFGFLRRHFGSARASVDLMVYTFEHPVLAEVLAERARAGVRVRLLVEGRPAGGIDPNQRWALAHIAAAGGEVHWLDAGGDVGPRYRGMHAKVAVLDARTALIGSENPNPGAAPDDDLTDGTAGRRGVYLATDAPAVVKWAADLIARDLDPAAHVDVRPFQPRDPDRGAPAPDFEPNRASGGAGYSPIAPRPLAVESATAFEWITAPENALAPDAGLPGLLGRAGPGDEVLVEQLDEPVWWGDGPAEGPVALNPRVEAYLAAARRGARVRLLLDGFFDDPAAWNGNAATVAYVDAIRRSEGLDIAARLGNPAGLGLHNKMVLVRLGISRDVDEHWSHIGSLNGSEVASKANREAAVQVENRAVHSYLARVFAWDWAESGANAEWLPWVGQTHGSVQRSARHARGPRRGRNAAGSPSRLRSRVDPATSPAPNPHPARRRAD